MRRGSGDWAGRGLRNWHGSYSFPGGSCCVGTGLNLVRRADTWGRALRLLVGGVDSGGSVFSVISCSLRSARMFIRAHPAEEGLVVLWNCSQACSATSCSLRSPRISFGDVLSFLHFLFVTNASLDWYNFSMIKPQLTEEQREALEQHHGLLQVDEAGHKYVLMSMEVYRELMGVGTDEELQASLKALQAGLADIDAGRTRPFRDVLAELESE